MCTHRDEPTTACDGEGLAASRLTSWKTLSPARVKFEVEGAKVLLPQRCNNCEATLMAFGVAVCGRANLYVYGIVWAAARRRHWHCSARMGRQ